MSKEDVMKPFSTLLQTGVLGPGFTGDAITSASIRAQLSTGLLCQ